MSSPSHFQNRELIIPFDKVLMVEKHPPDRLVITLETGITNMILGDDCKAFLANYGTYLTARAHEISERVPANA